MLRLLFIFCFLGTPVKSGELLEGQIPQVVFIFGSQVKSRELLEGQIPQVVYIFGSLVKSRELLTGQIPQINANNPPVTIVT